MLKNGKNINSISSLGGKKQLSECYRSQVFSCEFYKIFKDTYFVKQKWTAAFENHVYLNSI